jgi:hypothetical protein
MLPRVRAAHIEIALVNTDESVSYVGTVEHEDVKG